MQVIFSPNRRWGGGIAVAAADTHFLFSTLMESDNTHGGIRRSGSPGSYTYAAKPGFANRPVNYATFWDAARFVNWLNSGPPTGLQDLNTTENDMYRLNGVTTPSNTSILRQRNFALGEAGVAIASENERYRWRI